MTRDWVTYGALGRIRGCGWRSTSCPGTSARRGEPWMAQRFVCKSGPSDGVTACNGRISGAYAASRTVVVHGAAKTASPVMRDPLAGNHPCHWLSWRALINSLLRRDLVRSRRRRRNTLGNAQAEGLCTLISSGERPNGPPKGNVITP